MIYQSYETKKITKDKCVIICKEKGTVYVYKGKLDMKALSLRSRFNSDLSYYILKLHEDIKIETYLKVLNDRPQLLETSAEVEKI